LLFPTCSIVAGAFPGQQLSKKLPGLLQEPRVVAVVAVVVVLRYWRKEEDGGGRHAQPRFLFLFVCCRWDTNSHRATTHYDV
jgi:hypothetical protein